MATTNIAQIRRLVLRYKLNPTDNWTTVEINEDSLGQDSTMTVNIAPRMQTRASSRGTTETPIAGTIDNFASSITFIADNWAVLGKAIRRWAPATYDGATEANGQITDAGADICGDGIYMSIIAQGICDDGSSADVELTRCYPSLDDEIELTTTDATTVTLNLHPIIYNPSLHSSDGYPQYSYRFGDNSLTEKQRLNVTTGEYAAVNPAPTPTP